MSHPQSHCNWHRDDFCPELIILEKEDKAYCAIHSHNKPPLCDRYFCGVLGDIDGMRGMGILERYLVMSAVLDIFKIKPVPNAEEIREVFKREFKQEIAHIETTPVWNNSYGLVKDNPTSAI